MGKTLQGRDLASQCLKFYCIVENVVDTITIHTFFGRIPFHCISVKINLVVPLPNWTLIDEEGEDRLMFL